MINHNIEDEEYLVSTFGDESFVMFAKVGRDYWDYDNQTFSWDVTVYKMTQLWDNPALYIGRKPVWHKGECDYLNIDVAKTRMYKEVQRIEEMYEDGSLANRESMFQEIHRDYLADLIEAARLGRTEIDMICTFGSSDDRIDLRREALRKLDKAISQMEND